MTKPITEAELKRIRERSKMAENCCTWPNLIACRQDIPALLDEIERLREHNDGYGDLLKSANNDVSRMTEYADSLAADNKRLRDALEKLFNEFRNGGNLDKDQLEAMQQADDILTQKEATDADKEKEPEFRPAVKCITKGCETFIDCDYCEKCRKDWES